jgi:small subunit ribosomal protein S8e
MGISRSSKHKRRLTGDRMPIHQKTRKFEMGRQASSTKLSERNVVGVRGMEETLREEPLDSMRVTWISEKVTRK